MTTVTNEITMTHTSMTVHPFRHAKFRALVIVCLSLLMHLQTVMAGTGNNGNSSNNANKGRLHPNSREKKKPPTDGGISSEVYSSENGSHEHHYGGNDADGDGNTIDPSIFFGYPPKHNYDSYDGGSSNSNNGNMGYNNGNPTNDDGDDSDNTDANKNDIPIIIHDIYTENEFLSSCHYYFHYIAGTIDENTGGGTTGNSKAKKFISQIDYSTFFNILCNTFHDEDVPEFHCPSPTFVDLDIKLQLLFVTDICNTNSNELRINDSLDVCLTGLLSSNTDFGYHHSNNDGDDKDDKEAQSDIVGMMFDDICCELLQYMTMVGLDPADDSCSIMEPPTSLPSMEPSFSSYANMIPTPKPPVASPSQDEGDNTGEDVGGNNSNSNNIAVPSTGSSSNTKPKNDEDGVEGSGSTSGNEIPTTTLDTSRVGKNRLRAATIIAGVTLGAGGLCLMGIGSSRRFFAVPYPFFPGRRSTSDDGSSPEDHLPPHELFESSDGISDMDDSIM